MAVRGRKAGLGAEWLGWGALGGCAWDGSTVLGVTDGTGCDHGNRSFRSFRSFRFSLEVGKFSTQSKQDASTFKSSSNDAVPVHARDLEQRGSCGALFAASAVCVRLEFPETVATGVRKVECPNIRESGASMTAWAIATGAGCRFSY